MKISGSKWFGLVKTLAPMILSTVNPKLAPIADKVTDAIEQAESMSGLSGAEKLQHVKNIGHDAADSINAAHGSEVISKDGLDEAIKEGVDAVIAVKNVSKKA